MWLSTAMKKQNGGTLIDGRKDGQKRTLRLKEMRSFNKEYATTSFSYSRHITGAMPV